MAAIIAVAANTEGKREIVGLHIGPSEAETFWATFLKSLARRGLHGVKLVISDAHESLKAAIRRVTGASWQRCRVHARRKFYVLADVAGSARRAAHGKAPATLSPICLDAVQRIDALFNIERDINGSSAEARQAIRQARTAPLVADLHQWLGEQRTRLARGNEVARAIDYLLTRWTAFTRFLDDGRICVSNNAAERALRGVALGRKSWLFCGSDRGGQRAAVMYSLIVTARMNDTDPQAWLADVLARIADHPAQRLDDLLPWNWAKLTATPVDQAA